MPLPREPLRLSNGRIVRTKANHNDDAEEHQVFHDNGSPECFVWHLPRWDGGYGADQLCRPDGAGGHIPANVAAVRAAEDQKDGNRGERRGYIVDWKRHLEIRRVADLPAVF